MDCRTPIRPSSGPGSPGEPGGVLPGGGDQWSFLQFNGTLWVPSWMMPETVTAPETGEVLIAMGDNTAEFQAPIENSLLYRNAVLTMTPTNVWLHQWTYADHGGTTINEEGFAVALLAGNLRWMRAFHSTPIGTDDITYVIVVNGFDTALSVTLNSGSAGPAMNLTTMVPVVVGDLISARADGVTASRTTRTGVDFLLEYG